ncbi:hypothetical protein RN2511_044720 [Rhodococcus sp. NKCM2511]|nr:hypothetical protein RN2511_044720 [Rhodococcus sp. NKCM2511]
MRYLMARGVVVTVDGNHLDTEALERDDDLFAQLTCSEEHDPGGTGREWSTDADGIWGSHSPIIHTHITWTP